MTFIKETSQTNGFSDRNETRISCVNITSVCVQKQLRSCTDSLSRQVPISILQMGNLIYNSTTRVTGN